MSSRGSTPPAARYHIERAGVGYRVVGDGLLIWEPTLGEAVERREELEARGWRHRALPPPRPPPGAPVFEVVYGPVRSRRLGWSLGVDLTPPGARVCSFDCVYCEAGRERRREARPRWPTPDEVASRLGGALRVTGRLDSITISGHGEPTLHPRFDRVVDAVLREVRRSRRRTPVRILTNGSQVARPEVRRALDRLDERLVKLDADPERVNRPTRHAPLGTLVHGLGRLTDVSLQSCFVDGAVSNVAEETIAAWAELVGELEPRRVQIYTIDHPSASADARPASAALLEEIACQLRARTGIEAEIYP